MIQFTPDEFQKVREAIASAHLLIQAVAPLLKQRHTHLNRDQRNLLTYSESAVPAAFNIIAAITHRENRDPESEAAAPPNKLADIDVRAMRDELENVSALVLPDLLYQMVCALGELPMYHNLITSEPLTTHRAAQLMAWTWEAGRRYGIQQALAIADGTIDEFKANTGAVLCAALNGTLDLPAPDKPGPTAEIVPFEYPPADTAETDDVRSTRGRAAIEAEAEERLRIGNTPTCDECGTQHGEHDCPALVESGATETARKPN